MKAKLAKLSKTAVPATLIAAWLFGACSTTEVKPVPPPKISPPDYVQVPHPEGFDVNDVVVLFRDPKAMSPESLKSCDADFMKLRKLTQSLDEVRQGAREMVKSDPVAYHWCFYSKILELEASVKSMNYVDEKQKKVLDTYAFLVPVARGFMREFHDSRYLRWAIRHYRHLSEWVFYRKLEQNPQMTAELTEVTNPFGLWREPSAAGSVLEKYHLTHVPGAEPSSVPAPLFPPTADVAPPSEPTAAASPAAPAQPGPERYPAKAED